MKYTELTVATLPAGTYVVGVSGGVDSMVLLDLLRHQKQITLVVAHVDHGIRPDSHKDKQLVERFCMSHNITFIFTEVNLGPGASEETARDARYKFLRHVAAQYHALAIITAHHRDDLLETAVINLLRGTGRRGLTALASHDDLLRPLLQVSKRDLQAHAAKHHIPWREDFTNQDQSYLRNYVRQSILADADETAKQKLLKVIVRQKELNQKIDTELADWVKQNATQTAHRTTLPRYQLIMLPQKVVYEILQYVLKQRTGQTLERPLAERALLLPKRPNCTNIFY